jgi:LPS sulfotransferase NodH
MRKFFVLSYQRSGTTWFCEKIAGMFGRWGVSKETEINWWEEVGCKSFIDRKKLNHHCLDLPDFCRHPNNLEKLEALDAFQIDDYTSEKIVPRTESFYKEVFNSLDNEFINIMYDQCNLNSILNYPLIHFVRRDTVSQVVSTYLAEKTDIWHNNNFYKEKINNLSQQDRHVNLNFDRIYFNSIRINILKEAFFETLKKYHKDCLTVFYEDCLDEDYWKTILNKKLENFMQDSIKNHKYKTENQKTGNIFNVVNKNGPWPDLWESAISICEQNNLPANMDSLIKICKFNKSL